MELVASRLAWKDQEHVGPLSDNMERRPVARRQIQVSPPLCQGI